MGMLLSGIAERGSLVVPGAQLEKKIIYSKASLMCEVQHKSGLFSW